MITFLKYLIKFIDLWKYYLILKSIFLSSYCITHVTETTVKTWSLNRSLAILLHSTLAFSITLYINLYVCPLVKWIIYIFHLYDCWTHFSMQHLSGQFYQLKPQKPQMQYNTQAHILYIIFKTDDIFWYMTLFKYNIHACPYQTNSKLRY